MYRIARWITNCLPPLSARRKRLLPNPGEPYSRATTKARTHDRGRALVSCLDQLSALAVDRPRRVGVAAVVLEVVADVHVNEVLQVVAAQDRRLGLGVDRSGDVGREAQQRGERRAVDGRLTDRVVRQLRCRLAGRRVVVGGGLAVVLVVGLVVSLVVTLVVALVVALTGEGERAHGQQTSGSRSHDNSSLLQHSSSPVGDADSAEADSLRCRRVTWGALADRGKTYRLAVKPPNCVTPLGEPDTFSGDTPLFGGWPVGSQFDRRGILSTLRGRSSPEGCRILSPWHAA